MKKNEYESPVIEIIEVEVERGFAGSVDGIGAVGGDMPGGGETSLPGSN